MVTIEPTWTIDRGMYVSFMAYDPITKVVVIKGNRTITTLNSATGEVRQTIQTRFAVSKPFMMYNEICAWATDQGRGIEMRSLNGDLESYKKNHFMLGTTEVGWFLAMHRNRPVLCHPLGDTIQLNTAVTGDWRAQVSPDGMRVVFENMNGMLTIFNVETQTEDIINVDPPQYSRVTFFLPNCVCFWFLDNIHGTAWFVENGQIKSTTTCFRARQVVYDPLMNAFLVRKRNRISLFRVNTMLWDWTSNWRETDSTEIVAVPNACCFVTTDVREWGSTIVYDSETGYPLRRLSEQYDPSYPLIVIPQTNQIVIADGQVVQMYDLSIGWSIDLHPRLHRDIRLAIRAFYRAMVVCNDLVNVVMSFRGRQR
jgi:hypothetical protein